MMRKFDFGPNAIGARNTVYYDETTGELICRDTQPAEVVQEIIDENKIWRDTERTDRHNQPPTGGRKVASIPITLWQSWRFEWMRNHRDKFTWGTYELMRLSEPENAVFLTTNKPLPKYGSAREFPVMV